MKFNRKEKIEFTCDCQIEEIEMKQSMRTGEKYAKIISTENSCFLCFKPRMVEKLTKILAECSVKIHISGEVAQRKGGTFLSALKFETTDETNHLFDIETVYDNSNEFFEEGKLDDSSGCNR